MKRINIMNVISPKSGISPSSIKFSEDGIYKYFKVSDMNNNKNKLIKSSNYFNDTLNLIPAGSIIFPKRGASIFTNKISILGEDSMIDTNLMALIVNDQKYNKFFLFHFLKWFKLYNIADTSSIPQINNVHFKNFLVPFIDLQSQEKTSKFLSSIDQLINNFINIKHQEVIL